MSKTIIGVMGPGDHAQPKDMDAAFELGTLIASHNWILLTGGRNVGVMHAASRGVKEAGGLTVGILPSEHNVNTSEFVDIPIYTGMGSARNNINILSSQVVISCGLGMGTVSEITLALKSDKPVVLLDTTPATKAFFQQFDSEQLHFASSSHHAIEITQSLLSNL